MRLPSLLICGAICTACASSRDIPAAPTTEELAKARARLNAPPEPPSVILARGRHDPQWNRTGVDLLGRIAAAPGGLAGNHLVLRGDGSVVTIAYDGDPALAVPADWRLVAQADAAAPSQGLYEHYAMRMRDRLYVVSSHPARREGDAVCTRYTGAVRIYVAGSAPLDAAEESAVRTVLETTRASRDVEICVAARQRRGRLRLRSYDAAGFALPLVDVVLAEREAGIAPRQPLSAYLRPNRP